EDGIRDLTVLEFRRVLFRSDVLELHGAAKVPHWNRDQIARMLGRAQNSVHLYEGHVGGAFGVRGELYPEDVLACAAALEFRRPEIGRASCRERVESSGVGDS